MTNIFDQIIERRHSNCLKWGNCDPDVLPLWVADMDFPAPDPVIQALHERVEHGIFGYGQEPAELRDIVVARMEHLYDWNVSPDALVFIPGVVPGVYLSCRVAAKTGDSVLVQPPVYSPILRAPESHGLSLRENELVRDPDGHYRIDFDGFEASIDKSTHLFILCNPHNPVGRVFTRDELKRMGEICLRHDVTICSDEIHCDLIFSNQRHIPIASLSPEIEKRTITLIAPSKTFNIAGLDCSVAIIPDARLREKFTTARSGLVPGVNVLGYVAALSAYRDCEPWLRQVMAYLEANRDFLYDYVNTSLPGITMWNPEGTFLAWLDCIEAGIQGDPSEFFLNEARVALNEGPSYGSGGNGFVRLNFACPRVTLSEALERMEAALQRLP